MAEPNVSPKPLLDKLGAKPNLRMAALGFHDLAWTEDRPFDDCLVADQLYDLIVVRAEDVRGLRNLAEVKRALAPKGTFWIAYPRGGKTITQAEVMFAGNANGWTDVKVCRFSETDAALKFLRRRTTL